VKKNSIKNLLKKALFILFMSAFICVKASDSLKVSLQTSEVGRKFQFYKYKHRDKLNLLYEYQCEERGVESFNMQMDSPKQGMTLSIWIYQKRSWMFWGIWIQVITIYDENKDLLLLYSPIHKKHYKYVPYWVGKNEKIGYRD